MISIDILPDDVLLAIFDFRVSASDDPFSKEGVERWWQTLVHVCRRWRSLVFGSPRHLKLRLFCAPETPATYLDVWPPLPLAIGNHGSITEVTEGSDRVPMDNIVAVLKQSNRLCQVELLDLASSPMEKVLAAMQVPFPELTELCFSANDDTAAVPDSFLGGSAPLLRYLSLRHIPFPGLPKLLMSATLLFRLDLFDIPHSGYISPEAMLTALSVLTSLDYLSLEFQSPRSCPDQARRRLPPTTRTVLPVLRWFSFKGASEYLEDLVASIDAPRLWVFYIVFFNDIVFDMPQLTQFISRSDMPTFKKPGNSRIRFDDSFASIRLSPRTSPSSHYSFLHVETLCRGLDWQLSSLEQICSSSLPPVSTLENLYIYRNDSFLQPDKQDNIEKSLWLELLQPFTDVKNLHLSKELAPRIESALQELVEGRAAEVLPALQNIFLEELRPSGRIQEGFRQFAATRQVTGHPIAVSHWYRDLTE